MSKIRQLIDFCNSLIKNTLQNINVYLVYNQANEENEKKDKIGKFLGFSAQKHHSIFEVLLPQIK